MKAPRANAHLRIPQELSDNLHAAATARDVSFNWLCTKMLEDALGRLVPVVAFGPTKPHD